MVRQPHLHTAGQLRSADLRRLLPLQALDAARGLLYLHRRSPPIIHRDVKSPNILVRLPSCLPAQRSYPSLCVWSFRSALHFYLLGMQVDQHWRAKIADFNLR